MCFCPREIHHVDSERGRITGNDCKIWGGHFQDTEFRLDHEGDCRLSQVGTIEMGLDGCVGVFPYPVEEVSQTASPQAFLMRRASLLL